MDNNTKQKLIVVAAVFIAAVAFYYIASPYQNCSRSNPDRELLCAVKTAW